MYTLDVESIEPNLEQSFRRGDLTEHELTVWSLSEKRFVMTALSKDSPIL